MRRRPNRQQWPVVVGAACLLFGSVSLGMMPASANDAPAPATTTSSTTAPASTIATTPTTTTPTTAATPAETPAKKPPPATTTTTTTTTLPHGPAVAGGIVPCSTLPAGEVTTATDTCADMPCPTGINCGNVVAGPTSNLGPGQYVYLNFYDFAPGDTGTTIYYCADPGDLSTLKSPPTCGNTDTDSDAEAPQQIRIYPASTSTLIPQGTSTASIQAAEVSSPSDPISGEQNHPTVDEPGFYCDGTTANACSIVITDASITPGLPASTSSNSVEIPVSFASSSTSCTNPSVVSTESEFGIDLLMPELAKLSCADDPSSAVVPFETATDGLHAVTDLVQGLQQVAFTDDPEAPDQQAELAKGNFALIPVALTANVVSFYAQLNFSGNFTLDQMDLTPTMAAGLLTDADNYFGAATTDNKAACSGPSLGAGGDCLNGPGPCYGAATCSLYSQLNFINGYNQFASFQSVERSDASGATGQLFNWLCNAPVVPLPFGTHPVESASGATELDIGLSPASNIGPPVTICPATAEQVPSIAGSQRLINVNDPSQQALKANQAVFQSGTTANATAAFTDMNWAESRYYGMNVAALQNAAGAFVAPSAASLDAALNDAKANPDGTITPQNLASDPAAYPMPSVIYAVVPTAPIGADDASSIKEMLTQLLSLTSSGGSALSDLPDGFAPLPATVATTATADIAKDIHATSVTTTPPPNTTTPSTPGLDTFPTSLPPLNTLSYGNAFDSLDGINYVTTAGFNSAANALVSDAAAGSNSRQRRMDRPLLGPALPGYALAASHGKAILPEALSIGLLGILLGVLLMGGGLAKRRKVKLALAATTEAAAGTPEESP